MNTIMYAAIITPGWAVVALDLGNPVNLLTALPELECR